jgi:hypothetical protein
MSDSEIHLTHKYENRLHIVSADGIASGALASGAPLRVDALRLFLVSLFVPGYTERMLGADPPKDRPHIRISLSCDWALDDAEAALVDDFLKYASGAA